jgi:hypothetical protein
MDEDTKLWITVKQLKGITLENSKDKRFDIYAAVLMQELKEKTAGGVLADAMGKGVQSLLSVVDKATEPKKKGGKRI